MVKNSNKAGIKQCDQMLELKLAEYSPTLSKKEPNHFYIESEGF